MPQLFLVLLGCTPKGRLTEQHDVFFGIANQLSDLVPDFYNFWPEANKIMHIDCWRTITKVDNYSISIGKRNAKQPSNDLKLFFLNLGGYKDKEFEEYHYKLLCVAPNKSAAIKQAKQSAFYKHVGFKGAESHIDDKYGVDVDDVFEIEDVLGNEFKSQFRILIDTAAPGTEDTLNIGYLKLSKLLKK